MSPPEEWLISRICEEFDCTPEEALRQDGRLTMDIIELRGYARAKEALKKAKSKEDVPDSPMVDMVFAVQEERMRRRNG